MAQSVYANGIELWTDGFGDPSHPTILMIMGSSAAGLAGEDDPLTARLVAGGRHVIRYDARDTGRSTRHLPLTRTTR